MQRHADTFTSRATVAYILGCMYVVPYDLTGQWNGAYLRNTYTAVCSRSYFITVDFVENAFIPHGKSQVKILIVRYFEFTSSFQHILYQNSY